MTYYWALFKPSTSKFAPAHNSPVVLNISLAKAMEHRDLHPLMETALEIVVHKPVFSLFQSISHQLHLHLSGP